RNRRRRPGGQIPPSFNASGSAASDGSVSARARTAQSYQTCPCRSTPACRARRTRRARSSGSGRILIIGRLLRGVGSARSASPPGIRNELLDRAHRQEEPARGDLERPEAVPLVEARSRLVL